MQQVLDGSEELFDFRLAHAIASSPESDPVSRTKIAREFLDWFRRLRSPMEQSVYVQRLSERLSISEEAVRSELSLPRPEGPSARGRRSRDRRAPFTPIPPANPETPSAFTRLEDEVVAWLIESAGGPPDDGSVRPEAFDSPLARAHVEALCRGAALPDEPEAGTYRARLALLPRSFPDAATAIAEWGRADGRRQDERRLSDLKAALSTGAAEEASTAMLAEIQEIARKLKSPPRVHA